MKSEKYPEFCDSNKIIPLQDIALYAEWCSSIMDKIEEIAKEKYSNTTWVDTGSRWNVCMTMLEQFKQDLKVNK